MRTGWRERVRRSGALAALSLVAAACSTPREPSTVSSNDPLAQSKAVARVVDRGDRSAVPALIALLDSDDPAERLVAIGALRRLTGQDFGYDPTDAEWRRAAAADRWQAWWDSEGPGGPGSATSAAPGVGGAR